MKDTPVCIIVSDRSHKSTFLCRLLGLTKGMERRSVLACKLMHVLLVGSYLRMLSVPTITFPIPDCNREEREVIVWIAFIQTQII
jgi:hypothetical protein